MAFNIIRSKAVLYRCTIFISLIATDVCQYRLGRNAAKYDEAEGEMREGNNLVEFQEKENSQTDGEKSGRGDSIIIKQNSASHHHSMERSPTVPLLATRVQHIIIESVMITFKSHVFVQNITICRLISIPEEAKLEHLE